MFGKPGDAIHDGACFAAARASDDEQGAAGNGDRFVLGGVEGIFVVDHGAVPGGVSSVPRLLRVPDGIITAKIILYV